MIRKKDDVVLEREVAIKKELEEISTQIQNVLDERYVPGELLTITEVYVAYSYRQRLKEIFDCANNFEFVVLRQMTLFIRSWLIKGKKNQQIRRMFAILNTD